MKVAKMIPYQSCQMVKVSLQGDLFSVIGFSEVNRETLLSAMISVPAGHVLRKQVQCTYNLNLVFWF